MTDHPENYTTTPVRCPDCIATLDIPVVVNGLERGKDGKRTLTFQVHDEVFEPYIQRHMSLSDHPKLAEQIGDDWATADKGSDTATLGGPGVTSTQQSATKS